MIWFCLWIIVTIIAIICGICLGWDAGEKILYAIILGFVACLLGMLIMYGLNASCYSPSEKLELEETQKIYSLKDNSYLSGRGFISVTINEDDKYTYIIVNEDGTYSKKTIKSNNVRIKEVDNEEPILEKYICESKNKWLSVWSENYYCFVVPKGTVVNSFEIDLE